MNTRSASKNANANANNVNISVNDNIKDKFMSEVQALVNENINNQIPNYESLKTRIRSVIKIAKRINKEIVDVLPHWSNASRDRILSVMFITLSNLSKQSEGSHIQDYIDSERRSLKIRKMSLSVQSHCGKALSKLWELIHNYDVSNVPNYDTIVELHRQKQNKYNLRPRTAIVYTEEDQVDDISDADYNDELEQKMARMNRIVNYVVNKHSKKRVNDDDDEYVPEDDASDNDDESVHFDEDDYAEETEEDDNDYEDEDEYRQADLEFLDEYFNDSDYIQTSSKKVKKVQYEDDDEEYLPEDDADDDDDYLLDTVSESDYDDDSSSDYDPADDVNSNFLDDHVLHFDDDDYAEESEEDDDDYEDDSADEDDAQFVSDYFNDPDYDPAEDEEEEDEFEYDFSFKNKKENVELVLEAGIANDDGDDSEDYNPDEEDDEDDEDDVVKVCMNNKLIKVCKRLYNRATGKVNYKWVNMTEDEYNKKYDADYEEL